MVGLRKAMIIGMKNAVKESKYILTIRCDSQEATKRVKRDREHREKCRPMNYVSSVMP